MNTEQVIETTIDFCVEHSAPILQGFAGCYLCELNRLELKVERLKAERGETEEAEASCCPEDVGFVEYIARLESSNALLSRKVEAYETALREIDRVAQEWIDDPERDGAYIGIMQAVARNAINETQSGAARIDEEK